MQVRIWNLRRVLRERWTVGLLDVDLLGVLSDMCSAGELDGEQPVFDFRGHVFGLRRASRCASGLARKWDTHLG